MSEEPLPKPADEPPPPCEKSGDWPGLYLHIPFCLRKCAYCGFTSITDLTLISAFRAALRREMELYRGWADVFDTLYVGGGTPSVLSDGELEELIAEIRAAFPLTADAEVTLEANPGDITPSLLTSLGRAGVNRLNIGVQSFDDDALALLGRRHTAGEAVVAVRRARDAGFANIGLDLIYALPSPPGAAAPSPEADRNFASWLATLERAIRLAPDHLSCYQLTLEENTPLADRCRRGRLVMPDEARQADYFFTTSRILEENGYGHYEVSNFARPGYQSRHNRKYWNHTHYLGLGPAAHSFSGRQRRWNRSSVGAYIGDLEAGRAPIESRETLSDEQIRLEALFLGFRTERGIRLETLAIEGSRDLPVERREMIGQLTRAGLLEIRDGFLRPTRAGMAVADSLALL